jgi:DNA replication protein DnaC/AraC-like DNA-binding protein
MNNQQTADLLEGLKLKGMANAFTAMINQPLQQRPGMELAVAKLVDAERLYRKNLKTGIYLKTSRLRYNAVLEDVICSTERNLTKDQLSEISDCSFIARAENLLLTGLTGCGKSFLACAIGRQACTLGYKTEYLNMNKFIEKIALSKIDGTFLKVISRMEKNDLIILDDFALQPLDQNSRLALLQILEERYERKSIIIAWTGLFLYLAQPEVFQAFFPVYCLATLSVPVYLYAYILALVRNQKEKLMLLHYVLLCLSAVVIAGLPYFPGVGLHIVAVTVLPLVRFAFSGVYFGSSVYVLWHCYHEEQSNEKVRLIPASWTLIFMVLALIQFINSLIAVLDAEHVQSNLLPMAVASVMISLLIGVLLYNTICRNFELFRKSRKMPQTVGKKKTVSLHTPDSVSRHLPFTVQEFESLLHNNKLYLDSHLTLAALAERLDTNRSYVSGFINQTYGMNFNQYLNACRLKEFTRLKALRSNERKNSSELAKMAGFRNYPHYLRAKDKQKIHAKGGRKDEQ